MTEYVIGYMEALRDPETMAKYRGVAADALAKHGGKIIQPPTSPERLEGSAAAPHAFVLLTFPDGAAAKAWRDDPDLQEVHALRHAGADISFFHLEAPS